MKRLLLALGLLVCAANAGAQTTTFNGVVKDLTNTAVPTGQVTFQLKPGIDTTISGSSRFVPATTFCEIHNPGVVSTSGTGTITVVADTAQNWLVGDSIIFTNTADATLNASSVATPYVITVRNSATSFVFTQSGTHTNGAGGTVGGLYKSGGTGACAVMQNSALTPANTSYNVGIQAIFSPSRSFNTYAIGSGPVDISTVVPTPGQMPAYSFVDTFSNQSISGNKTFTGSLSLGNVFNFANIRIVDGVTYASVDAAVAGCGANPCFAIIPSNYGGADSSALVASSQGYKYLGTNANISILDLRAPSPAGPLTNNYSISFGGKSTGQFARLGVAQNCTSSSDSCIGAVFNNFVSGTMPSNGGTQTGAASIVLVTGTITRGASGARIVGHEGYVSLGGTGFDTVFPDVRGFTSSINIDRTGATQGAGTAAGYTASTHTNISTSGATIVNAYGFDAQTQNAGTARNYGYHSNANWLSENETQFHAVDSGGTPRIMTYWRNTNVIDNKPLSDAGGWNWLTQGGTGLFTITSTSVVSRVVHLFAGAASPNSAGGSALGSGALPWSSLFYGAAATNNAQLTGTFTAARTHTGPDASGTILISGNGDGTHAIKNQSVRFSGVLGGTCPTAAAIGAACTSGNINWTTSFGDNSYAVVCTLNGSLTGQPHIVGTTYQAGGAGITITIAADTAVAANVGAAGFTHCIAVHD